MLSAGPGPSQDRDWAWAFERARARRIRRPPNVQTEPPQERDGEARPQRRARRLENLPPRPPRVAHVPASAIQSSPLVSSIRVAPGGAITDFLLPENRTATTLAVSIAELGLDAESGTQCRNRAALA